jgi:hypothetical protein
MQPTCASPRLRQSQAALGFGYGLNEEEGASCLLELRMRLTLQSGQLALRLACAKAWRLWASATG